MKTLFTLTLTALFMIGCSPMNSEFSCNATAGDSCMTIEQVDAMTRYADGSHHRHLRTREARKDKRSLVWVKKSTAQQREFT